MAEKVKVKDFVRKIKKYGALLPVFFILPFFFNSPSIATVNFLMIVIVFYYACFMGPIYLLTYLISKFKLKQKFVDFLSIVSCFIMYFWTIFNWYLVFFDKWDLNFHAAIFVIPFVAFIRSSQVILLAIFLLFINNYLKSKFNKE